MTDKPPQEDSRKIWARVLSSIPHGLKVRTIAVRGDDEDRSEAMHDGKRPPREPPTPGRFGPKR